MNFFNFILQDQKANKNNTRGKIITFCFRIANYCRGNKALTIFFIPYIIFYKILVEWLWCIEIPYSTTIGKGFIIFHGYSLVINREAILGDNVTIRQNVTIGNAVSKGKSPVIKNNVVIGANAIIIGDIEIGENCIIGAGSVVITTMPPNSVVVGNPGRVIKRVLNQPNNT